VLIRELAMRYLPRELLVSGLIGRDARLSLAAAVLSPHRELLHLLLDKDQRHEGSGLGRWLELSILSRGSAIDELTDHWREAYTDDPLGRRALARNHATSAEQLAAWSGDDDDELRWAVWSNLSTPEDAVLAGMAARGLGAAVERESWPTAGHRAGLGRGTMLNARDRAASVAIRSQRAARLLLLAGHPEVQRGALAFFHARDADGALLNGLVCNGADQLPEFYLNPTIPRRFLPADRLRERQLVEEVWGRGVDQASLGTGLREQVSSLAAPAIDQAMAQEDPLWWLAKVVARGGDGGGQALAATMATALDAEPAGWIALGPLSAALLTNLRSYSPMVEAGVMLGWPRRGQALLPASAGPRASGAAPRAWQAVAQALREIELSLGGSAERWELWLSLTEEVDEENLPRLVGAAQAAARLSR